MLKKCKLLVIFCGVMFPFFASAKVCEMWNVSATLNSSTTETGIWTFTAGRDPGNMTGQGNFTGHPGTTVTFDLSATITELNQVFVSLRNSSDGNSCDYSGTKRGNAINGTFICASGTLVPTPWNAIVSIC